MGIHGRELPMRLALYGAALLVMVVPVAAQSPPRDMAADLAAQIASALPSGTEVALTTGADPSPDTAAIREQLATGLGTHGFRINAGGSATVRVDCRNNLREVVCVAEMSSPAGPRVAVATRPHTERAARPGGNTLSLQLQPIVSSSAAILDVAASGDRLLVLGIADVSIYGRRDGAWRFAESRPFSTPRAWPRDLRGRLHVEGDRFEAFLPGLVCTGSMAAAGLTCADRQAPWPIGFANTGLDPERNYFRTPEGLTFYSGAELGPAAGNGSVIADTDGALALLDASRQRIAVVGAADDVVRVGSSCADAAYAVTPIASLDGERNDSLQLHEAGNRRLVPAASPLVVPGRVTALWPRGDSTAATVVVRDLLAQRYAAFDLTIACDR